MQPIRMVDLQGQFTKIASEVQKAIGQVIEETSFINGPVVREFQKQLEDYLDGTHVIPCGNGTDALQIALMALDLKPGDEVITADFTFAATVEVIALLKLTPVLVDVDPETFNIDPKAVEKSITPKTKAIIPVHLFGQAAPMEPLLELAQKNNLFLVEDNAQGIGSTYTFSDGHKQKTGTIGTVGTTSFFPSKNLGGYGDGGAIFTRDTDLAQKIRGIVNHGMYKRYHHDIIGVNSRLDSLQAAVLNVKLKRLDFYNERRKAAAIQYTQRLSGHPKITTPIRHRDCDSHVFHQYTLRVHGVDRDALVEHLKEKNIPTGVYYPIPLHAQKAYQNSANKDEDFPVTNQAVKEVISLPMHTELSLEQIDYITTSLIEFIDAQ